MESESTNLVERTVEDHIKGRDYNLGPSQPMVMSLLDRDVSFMSFRKFRELPRVNIMYENQKEDVNFIDFNLLMTFPMHQK